MLTMPQGESRFLDLTVRASALFLFSYHLKYYCVIRMISTGSQNLHTF